MTPSPSCSFSSHSVLLGVLNKTRTPSPTAAPRSAPTPSPPRARPGHPAAPLRSLPGLRPHPLWPPAPPPPRLPRSGRRRPPRPATLRPITGPTPLPLPASAFLEGLRRPRCRCRRRPGPGRRYVLPSPKAGWEMQSASIDWNAGSWSPRKGRTRHKLGRSFGV
ncbi:uncharacterized protein LOC130454452 [Monodelphis domestica]|uniref:uncharacterized protein LOC130454452 n=1 Tax=Monodelphis domestica TaxID=13616 RepID=UPI0024E1EDAF|nr:uncharacterized protein LOC130454452 [Monodelphis domestica]